MQMTPKKRLVFKTLTYKLAASAATCAITYAISGDWRKMATVGASDALIKAAIYIAHEAAWSRFSA